MSKKKEEAIVEKNMGLGELLSSPMNILFAVFTIFTVGMMVPFTKACIDCALDKTAKKPDGYEFPQFSDMKLMAVSSVGFAILEYVCRQILYIVFVPICKEQNDIPQRTWRSGKGAFCTYKFFYFIAATYWGYYVLIDEYYMPKWLGGKGDFTQSFREYPYAKHAYQLKEYSLVTMGYHVGGLINHFINPRRNDFLEMALHHIVSLYLFGGYYLFNVWETGAVIALLHDIADITANLVKLLAESRFKTATAVVFVIHMVIWFYTRLFLLPIFIYQIWTAPKEIEELFGSPIVKPFFCYLLFCMFTLHAYWFMMFVKMLHKYMRTGSTEDQQNKLQVAEKKKDTNRRANLEKID